MGGDGNAFTDPRMGDPAQREVALQPERAAFLQISFDDIGDARPRRVELRPVTSVEGQPDANGQSPSDFFVSTAEVIETSDGKTALITSAPPAEQRSNDTQAGE